MVPLFSIILAIKQTQKRNNVVARQLGTGLLELLYLKQYLLYLSFSSLLLLQKFQEPRPGDDKVDAPGATTSSLKQDRFPSNSFYSIPQAFLVSSNLGGQPISLEMAVVSRPCQLSMSWNLISPLFKTHRNLIQEHSWNKHCTSLLLEIIKKEGDCLFGVLFKDTADLQCRKLMLC